MRKNSSFWLSDYAIEITTKPGTMKEAYKQGEVWRDENGGLCLRGYAGCGEARGIKTKCCEAVVGFASVRLAYKSGSSAGIDWYLAALVAGSTQTARLDAEIEFQDSSVFEAIVASLQVR